MFRYDFREWNGEKFAKLCNALLMEFVSEKVRPFFTAGPDAGRDADYKGPGKHGYEDWNGKWVFQYKFHDCALLGVKKARELIKRDLKSELSKIVVNAAPDNYILLTNVPFSGVVNRGTHDWFRRLMDEFPQIRNAEVWDYTKIEALLDISREIRQNYFPSQGYGDCFIKDVVQEVSQSVLTEAFDKLFSAATAFEGPIRPVPEKDLDEVVDLLWNIHENLSQLSAGFTTISNFMYMWPELSRLQYIFSGLRIKNINIQFGETLEIETKGGLLFNQVLQDEWIFTGPEGGKLNSHRTMFATLKRVVRECNGLSQRVHAGVMALLEKYPGVAKQIAGSAKKEFEQPAGYPFQSDTLLAPMQYQRFNAVADIISALDKWLDQGPTIGSPFDADLITSGKFYSAAELNQALRKAIRQVLRKPTNLVKGL